jgi:hypothetical protein
MADDDDDIVHPVTLAAARDDNSEKVYWMDHMTPAIMTRFYIQS